MNNDLGKHGGITSDPRFVLFLLTIIYTSNVLDRQILSILAQPIKADLGLSDTQLGLLTGLVFALFYTIFGIPAAWLADRFGRIRVMGAACLIWSVFSATCGFAQSFTQLALARVGVGIGEAGGTSPSYSLIADNFAPEKRATALAVFSLGGPLGILAGTVVGSWVAVEYGWRAAFYVVSLPGLIFATLLWLLVKEPRAGRMEAIAVNSSAGSLPPPSQLRFSLIASILDFFRNPILCRASLAGGLATFVVFAMMNWLPAFLMRSKGMELGDVAKYFGVIAALSMAIGLWAGGRLSDTLMRVNRKAPALVPSAAFLAAMPVFILAVLTPGWALALVCFSVPLALTLFYAGPTLAAIQNASSPESRTVSSSIYSLVINLLGLGLGPLYVGMVSDFASARELGDPLGIALLSLSPFFVLASVAYYSLSRTIGQKSG